MDDPVPIRRWAAGCLAVAVLVGIVMLLIRPTIFTLAPPRDDASVVVAAASELGPEPIARQVILSRSRGWIGELAAADGRVELTVLVARSASGAVSAVNAASADGCAVEMSGDRLEDCDGRTWTVEGEPIDADRPLERFPARIDGTSVVVDLTRTVAD